MRNTTPLSCASPRVVGYQLRTCMLTGDANLPKDLEFASPDFPASPQSTQTEELTT